MTAAPWFTDLVMPDIFAPLCVLLIYLLAWGRPALPLAVRIAVALLAAIAIASHLAHLVLAAGCLAMVLLWRPRRLLVCAAPLILALGWLLGSNLVGNGVLGVSPYGSGLRPGPAAGGWPGGGLPAQRLPPGRLSALRLVRSVADG